MGSNGGANTQGWGRASPVWFVQLETFWKCPSGHLSFHLQICYWKLQLSPVSLNYIRRIRRCSERRKQDLAIWFQENLKGQRWKAKVKKIELWASAVRTNNQRKNDSNERLGVMSSVTIINHDRILSIWGGGRCSELSKRNAVC